MAVFLPNVAALQMLRKGCGSLQQPPELADELVRFLTVKRLADRLGIPVSSGGQVEDLWRWTLLNTEVARAVHEVVGGEVEHTTAPDDHGMGGAGLGHYWQPRLLALNLMRLHGWVPNLQFWKRPAGEHDHDTYVAEDIICVTAGGLSVYLHTAMSRSEAREAAVDLLDDCVRLPLRMAALKAGLLDAVTSVLAQDSEEEDDGGADGDHYTVPYTLHIKTLVGKIMAFEVVGMLLVADVKELVCLADGSPPHQQRFIYNGQQLEDERRLQDYNVQPDAEFHVILRMTGC